MILMHYCDYQLRFVRVFPKAATRSTRSGLFIRIAFNRTAFLISKTTFAEKPILQHFQKNLPLQDTSGTRPGAILVYFKRSEERVIMYGSERL